jgi:hypothetical protein
MIGQYQPHNFDYLLSQLQLPSRRKIFISYHHGGDQYYYNGFSQVLESNYDVVFDNSLEREIDSDNVDYVIQRIRDNYISGSSCTIVLCGRETPWRKYVDWEIKATLDMQHGLVAINLPTNLINANRTFRVPDRLHDNIQSGYAVWTDWQTAAQNAISARHLIEQAVGRSTSLIAANRPMMSRNGTPPWK